MGVGQLVYKTKYVGAHPFVISEVFFFGLVMGVQGEIK
jgi:hypothetical protein